MVLQPFAALPTSYKVNFCFPQTNNNIEGLVGTECVRHKGTGINSFMDCFITPKKCAARYLHIKQRLKTLPHCDSQHLFMSDLIYVIKNRIFRIFIVLDTYNSV